jgi:hypothetical protein
MGLLRRGGDEPQGRRFRMREKLLSIRDDFWIEDEGVPLAAVVALEALTDGR